MNVVLGDAHLTKRTSKLKRMFGSCVRIADGVLLLACSFYALWVRAHPLDGATT